MSTKVAMNGFGRVGRAAFRAAYERELGLEWVGINDLAEPAALAHLLKYDSVYGRFPGQVEVGEGVIRVDDSEIPVFGEPDPPQAPVGRARRGSRDRGDRTLSLRRGSREAPRERRPQGHRVSTGQRR